jgi:GH15 family glucan-1,4-alpha-glucosidase
LAVTEAPQRIEDYALIGDCETAALVSNRGSIDWLCFPRFDSAACFAALLGTPENGRWSIRPRDDQAQVTRRYRDGTLILETTFETAEGSATLIDFMPPRDCFADLVRIVVGHQGRVEFDVDLVIRFDYGRSIPWVSRLDGTTLTAVAGPDLLVLRTAAELHGADMHTVGSFTVTAGQRIPFTLIHAPSHRPAPAPRDPEADLERTEAFWTAFSGRCPPVGTWTTQVKRSLITLKALTYMPTGGIVAAATTSFPNTLAGRGTGTNGSAGCVTPR